MSISSVDRVALLLREQYAEAAAAQAKIKQLTSELSDVKRRENSVDRNAFHSSGSEATRRKRSSGGFLKDMTWAVTLTLLLGAGVLMFVRIVIYGEMCAIPEHVCIDDLAAGI